MFAGIFPYYPEKGIVFLFFLFFFAVNLRLFSRFFTTPSPSPTFHHQQILFSWESFSFFFQGWRIKLQGCGQQNGNISTPVVSRRVERPSLIIIDYYSLIGHCISFFVILFFHFLIYRNMCFNPSLNCTTSTDFRWRSRSFDLKVT